MATEDENNANLPNIDVQQGSDGDSVTEVTQKSWLQRIGSSFGGVVTGFVLIAVSVALLFWNEGRAVTTARSLSEGAGIVRSVSSEKLDTNNDGKLVHVAGNLTPGGPATDPEFGMTSSGVRLVRTVEMYQWIEESESSSKKEVGGSEKTTTTYKYTRAWKDKPVESGKFKEPGGHRNPDMVYQSRITLAPDIKLGVFETPDNLMRGFGTEEPMPAAANHLAAIRRKLDKTVHVVDGKIYVGEKADQPRVGDYRIGFAEVPVQPASIIARQAGTNLEPYRTQAGGTVQLIAAGRVPAADMFQKAQADNSTLTWILRAVGCVLMFVGFSMIMGPLGVLADVLPILGDIVRAGTGLVALLCTVAIAPLVIAIAWLFYRPLLSVGILVVGAGLTYGVIWLAKQRKAAKAAALPKAAPA